MVSVNIREMSYLTISSQVEFLLSILAILRKGDYLWGKYCQKLQNHRTFSPDVYLPPPPELKN